MTSYSEVNITQFATVEQIVSSNSPVIPGNEANKRTVCKRVELQSLMCIR